MEHFRVKINLSIRVGGCVVGGMGDHVEPPSHRFYGMQGPRVVLNEPYLGA